VRKTALLALADGRIFRGESLGAQGEARGEVVFNTSMTGYQEILTDPSYKGQIVVMTYPLIGNYGMNDEDVESRRPWVEGFIVKEASRAPSSWRGRVTLDDYLRHHGIVGIHGIDTRALTRHLRDHGAQEGVITTEELDPERLVARARAVPRLIGRDLVRASAESLDGTTWATVALVIVVLLLVYRAPLLALVPLVTIAFSVVVSLKILALVTLIPELRARGYEFLLLRDYMKAVAQ